MRSNKKYLFWGLFAVMAVYYGYRMFAFTPWYDELYTYYCFISKGPVYAAVHWPLPNNHVGYSVLSACLDIFGNSYIGLRGISYLCALANLYLIYKISKRYIDELLALAVVILYVSMNLVNQLAVQGRGYTLGITCFLAAWECMIRICEEETVLKWIYAVYIVSLVWGLYTVTSNVYWVIPLCIAGGIFLLLKSLRSEDRAGSLKQLIRLVTASLIAALGTILLYATIWLAIGSNLLVKEEGGRFYGMGHVQMILKSPFAAIGRGMEYMLATPYIQSEERAGFVVRLMDWIKTLAGYYYNSLAVFVIGIWIVGALYLGYRLVQDFRQKKEQYLLLYLVLLTEGLLLPIILLLQCKRPYYRVFTYGGVLLAVLIGILLRTAVNVYKKGNEKNAQGNKASLVILGLTLLFGVKCLVFSDYNGQYGVNEYEIQDAFSKGQVKERNALCVTDCNQEYLLYFLYGVRCENRQIEGSDLVLLDKRMTDPEFDEMVWEFYQYYDTIPWDYIDQNMTKIYENDHYVLYAAKE